MTTTVADARIALARVQAALPRGELTEAQRSELAAAYEAVAAAERQEAGAIERAARAKRQQIKLDRILYMENALQHVPAEGRAGLLAKIETARALL